MVQPRDNFIIGLSDMRKAVMRKCPVKVRQLKSEPSAICLKLYVQISTRLIITLSK